MQELLRWFLPPRGSREDADAQRRALLVIGGCFATAAIAGTVALMQWRWGVLASAAASGICALVAAAIPFAVRATGAWRAGAAGLVGAVWLPALAIGVASGGVLVAALYYLALGAAIAALTLGYWSGIALGVLNALVVGGLYVAHAAGAAPPIAIDAEVELGSAMRGAFVFNVALAALVAAYELLRTAARSDSEANERRYRALSDSGPDLIAEISAAGRVLYSSAGGGDLPRAMIGRTALTAVHREDQPALVSALKLLHTQPSVRVGPLRWMTSRTEAIWFEASLTRYRVGDEPRVLVVARNVSQRIALETQLHQSQKMQAVGQLASGLAHDVNNLLMVVSGHAEMIASRTGENRELLAAANEIQRVTDQGAALMRRLVGFSRPAALSRQVLELSAAVRASERLLRVLLGEGVALVLELATDRLPVRADAGELEQVLVNLVANARDALGSSGTVRIATSARGKRATLTVHDNGGGIDPALRERIFEPFFTTKKAAAGAGLGLYMVYTVVSGLGGEIEVDSDVGSGTRITVLLPLADEGGAAAPLRPPAPPAGGSERILLVEDRPALRTLLREALEAVGYEVTVACDAVEALALEVADRIDLVVSDVVMPRMGGIALVAALREKRPELRVLFITGDPGDAGRFDPRDRVMRKPFLIRDLRRVVREMLDTQRGGEQAACEPPGSDGPSRGTG
jgi:PAS domain S-box-containing protein